MESDPEASGPFNGALQPEGLHLPIFEASTGLVDSIGSDGFSEVLLDQYADVDMNSEWLSSFVEECLSNAGNCLLPPNDNQTTITNTNSSKTLQQAKPNIKKNQPTNQNFAIPSKPRGQRKRKVISSKIQNNPLTKWSNQLKQRSPSLQSAFFDPPLLEQTYWLADSELLTMPRREGEEEEEVEEKVVREGKVEKENSQGQQQQQQPRRCSHCQAQKTPQWRAGPLGPKTLCNACGMRYFKSGRLLPEYRPAKSPTFVSYKHSNSHKKVLQMRTAILSSSNSPEH